jgi:hypothetical protein
MTRYHITILLTSILLYIGTAILAIVLKRPRQGRYQLFKERRTTLQTNDQRQDQGQKSERSENIFDENLREAGLTARLQQPRLTVQQGKHSPATPERYGYIQAMVEKNMSAQEIASCLSLSLHETTQLITLIKIKHPGKKCLDTPQSTPDNAEKQSMTPSTPPGQYALPSLLSNTEYLPSEGWSY